MEENDTLAVGVKARKEMWMRISQEDEKPDSTTKKDKRASRQDDPNLFSDDKHLPDHASKRTRDLEDRSAEQVHKKSKKKEPILPEKGLDDVKESKRRTYGTPPEAEVMRTEMAVMKEELRRMEEEDRRRQLEEEARRGREEEEERRREEEMAKYIEKISILEKTIADQQEAMESLQMSKMAADKDHKTSMETLKEAMEEQNTLYQAELEKVKEENQNLAEKTKKLEGYQEVCKAVLTGEATTEEKYLEFLKETATGAKLVHVAVTLGDARFLRQLMSQGLETSAVNRRGWTPMELAAARGDTNMLHVFGSFREVVDSDGCTLLHIAAANLQEGAVRWLLKRGVNKDAAYKQTIKASHLARAAGNDALADDIDWFDEWFTACRGRKRGKPISPEILQHLQLHVPQSHQPQRQENGAPISPKRKKVASRKPSPSPSQKALVTEEGSFSDGDQELERKPILSKRVYGLPNLGNTCYMNSALQCLFHVTSFTEHFLSGKYQGELLQGVGEDGEERGEVARAHARVMEALRDGHELERTARRVKRLSGRRNSMFMDSGQKEAHDFLSQWLEWIHQDLSQDASGSDETESFVSRMFHGYHESIISCPETGAELNSVTESFSNLSLSVTKSSAKSLKELFQHYYRRQEMIWDCDRCGKEHPCHQQVTITKLPEVLIIHFSRVNEAVTSSSKRMVSYPPDDLTLEAHTSTKTSLNYRLIGVCCHSGSMVSGHYTAYCLRDGNTWYSISDTFVQRATLSEVLGSHSAHILFYQAT